MTTLAASRSSARSLGKMPTTSVRRPISRLTRSSGLVERSFGRWSSGKALKASRSSSASSSRAATFGSGFCSRSSASPTRPRASSPVSALKIGLSNAATMPCWSLRYVPERLAQEVDAAALPGAAEHLADRLLQPGVRVGDDELHAAEAALYERAEA